MSLLIMCKRVFTLIIIMRTHTYCCITRINVFNVICFFPVCAVSYYIPMAKNLLRFRVRSHVYVWSISQTCVVSRDECVIYKLHASYKRFLSTNKWFIWPMHRYGVCIICKRCKYKNQLKYSKTRLNWSLSTRICLDKSRKYIDSHCLVLADSRNGFTTK